VSNNLHGICLLGFMLLIIFLRGCQAKKYEAPTPAEITSTISNLCTANPCPGWKVKVWG